ncbi:MAG TPA: hypothetical protein DCY88_18100, partial [Cyanobacteria bacterium UBA11372]|nr:hypothetical protein [Cyanobacteria bacterium UBA11372]
MNPPPLVNYLIAQNETLPVFNASMYEFIMAGNGVILRSIREGLSVIAPFLEGTIPGLAFIPPQFHLQYPKVPSHLLEEILRLSQQVAPKEILFHLCWSSNRWQLKIPPQTNDLFSVTRLDSSANILIELHSHHIMEARFSSQDNLEESGFKIYGVIGKIFTQPILRLRVGIYHRLFWEIP